MFKKIIFITLFSLFGLYVSASDKVYTVDNLPKVHLQDASRYVCDPEGLLTPAAVSYIDEQLRLLEDSTGVESVVAVVPDIGDVSCFDFCHNLLNKWGVGKKGADNGFVLLLVTKARCVQLYTGYGLEGVLPDAICKRIQQEEMVPHFAKGDWDTGLQKGVSAIVERLQAEGGTPVSRDEDGGFFSLSVLITLVFGVVFFISFFSISRGSRCSSCGKRGMRTVSRTLLDVRGGARIYRVLRRCRHCGHEEVVHEHRRDDDDTPFSGGRGVFPGDILFGRGFGGGGGGFGGGIGGSFGGGAGGGGGAGSRF